MISESVILFQDDSGVRRHVSEGGRGFRHPRHDEKRNDGIENITDHAIAHDGLRVDWERRRSFVGLHCDSCRHH